MRSGCHQISLTMLVHVAMMLTLRGQRPVICQRQVYMHLPPLQFAATGQPGDMVDTGLVQTMECSLCAICCHGAVVCQGPVHMHLPPMKSANAGRHEQMRDIGLCSCCSAHSARCAAMGLSSARDRSTCTCRHCRSTILGACDVLPAPPLTSSSSCSNTCVQHSH